MIKQENNKNNFSFLENDVYGEDGIALASIIDISIKHIDDINSTIFFTNHEHPLQVGVVPLKLGDTKAVHTHPSRTGVNNLQEICIVLRGRVAVLLVDDEKLLRKELYSGNLVHIYGGPHGFEALEDSLLLLLKQGEGDVSEKKFYE